jgi:hypothetical protein
MPNRSTIARLTQLTAAGMDVYPTQLRGLARAAIREKPAERFLAWVKLAHPRLFAAAVQRAGVTANGNGARLGQVAPAPTQSALDRVLSAITTLAPAFLQAKAQKDLLEVQLDRARNNLPPLDPTQYAPAVQVSVSPASAAAAASAAGAAARPYLIWGAVGLGVLFVVTQLQKRRR